MGVRWRKSGAVVEVEADFPVVPQQVLLEIVSDRNAVISRMSDVSPADPDKTPGPDRYPQDSDTWFAVVDVRTEAGMFARVTLSPGYKKGVWCNSYLNPSPFGVDEEIAHIPAERLADWENALFLLSKTATVTKFALYKEIPLVPTINRVFAAGFTTLSEDWGGIVTVYFEDSTGIHSVGQAVIPRNVPAAPTRSQAVPAPSPEMVALDRCLTYLLRSQNHSPNSPHQGGLFLFYDLQADTYRNGQWPWSWGPAIRALLDASRLGIPGLTHDAAVLAAGAREIGETSLRFCIRNSGHPTHGFGTTRYTVRTNEKFGYQELVNTGSDAGFLAGWGWIPLYDATGDKRFLDAAQSIADALPPILKAFPVPPQEWLPAADTWTDFTIDESGFGTEGIAAVSAATEDSRYQKICRDYMDAHLAVFERPDGLWNRQYRFSTAKVDETERMTRGMGWAMEGLLAAYRCTGDAAYLEKAKKMAAVLMEHQSADGSWNFKFDRSAADVGVADKGTALWCLLLYMLHKETGDAEALVSARKALEWCKANQYTGPNPHAYGGIVSVSGESGITYRHWFPMCCQYTSAFFALALLEEIKMRSSKRQPCT